MKKSLHSDDDIIESINLTAKLESSLKKLLSSKKKNHCTHHCQVYVEQHQKIIEEMQTLRAQKQQLTNDNQLLSGEVMNCRLQIRELSKEIKELKKYINFLQSYNSSLKKEMAFWVKKPKSQQLFPDSNPNPNYQLLNQEIDNLKRMNNLKEKSLLQIDKTMEIKPISNSFLEQHVVKSPSVSKKMTKKSFILSKNENQCTSCSYAKMLKSSKVMNKSSSGSKRKKLCPCHKSYIQTSDFLY